MSPRRSIRLVALWSLVMAPLHATPVSAHHDTVRKKLRKAQPAPTRVYDDSSRWYPNNADKLKIGSQIWWDQMYREGRIGGGPLWRR